MDDLNQKLFQTFHMFHKLNFSDLLPDGISRNDFSTMMCIRYGKKCRGPHNHEVAMNKAEQEENNKISISTLAKALYVTTPAVSRTLKNLEEKGLVIREVDTKDRRNTFVFLTEKGMKLLKEADDEMKDFSSTVVHNMKEEDMEKLIDYLQRFFYLSQDELDRRKKNKLEEKAKK